jgi:prophage regulatory protein
MAIIRKPYPKTAPDLQRYPQSQSRTALDKTPGGGPQALCDPPEIDWRADPLREANDQATWAAQQEMDSDDPENEWAAPQEMDSETLRGTWDTHEKLASAPAPRAASIPSGVTMLSTPVVYKRRCKKRSAHYKDIQEGLFIEPVLIGLRAKATPDYEVDILIAADIAGKSDDEKRELVRKLLAARKGVL